MRRGKVLTRIPMGTPPPPTLSHLDGWGAVLNLSDVVAEKHNHRGQSSRTLGHKSRLYHLTYLEGQSQALRRSKPQPPEQLKTPWYCRETQPPVSSETHNRPAYDFSRPNCGLVSRWPANVHAEEQ